MAILKWEASECDFVCTACGARYGYEEIARAFSYSDVNFKNFVAIHCMDCGEEMIACDLTDYSEDDVFETVRMNL